PRLIADTATVKQVIGRSATGCTDTAYVDIKVPPYNDFSVTIDEVQCAAGDSLLVRFTVTNDFKRAVIPEGLPLSFYTYDPHETSARLLPPMFTVPDTVKGKAYSGSVRIKGLPPGKIYASVNDSATAIPVVFARHRFPEKSYSNNVSTSHYNGFTVTAQPPLAVLEWGDTLQLEAKGEPEAGASYQWSNAAQLSCTGCPAPVLIADTTILKRVVATGAFGCTDTAWVDIQVPPYNDFTATIRDAQCAGGDSLHLEFTLENHFKRGVLPKDLTVAFYRGDPRSASATLLQPVFTLGDTVRSKASDFSFRVKGMEAGNLYAVVNHGGKALPVTFPATDLLEKTYSNNLHSYAYAPEVITVQPSDTTVLRRQPVPLVLGTPVVDPASVVWNVPAAQAQLDCDRCLQPTARALDSTIVQVEMANRYGCTLKGTAKINVLPPDFYVRIEGTQCYTNGTARVTFTVCLNPEYDSLPGGLPVAFYNGDPAGGAHPLSPVFFTPKAEAGHCFTYTTNVEAPAGGKLYAVANDLGLPGRYPSPGHPEVTLSNNADGAGYVPFTLTINPPDTLIRRQMPVQLTPGAEGGTLTAWAWKPAPFLPCTDCREPEVAPGHTVRYEVRGRNEFHCTDTAYAIVRTHTGAGVFLPNAFTPGNDRKNDVFYAFTGPDVVKIRSFLIFNRWGDKVFEAANIPANDPLYGWNGRVNGKEGPAETYVYVLTLEGEGGTTSVHKGTVTVIR
ncbi:MAG TPA: gliding motility-associated C-terminal domain-containing protein, partial [Chitinophagaceae bacterium]|nr:gliding motility-associated C-terminal domain-containing protein [Chitinophagaceae bacterium]